EKDKQSQDVLKSFLIAKDKYDRTSLHIAAEKGHKDIMEALIKIAKELDKDKQPPDVLSSLLFANIKYNGTPLHSAAYNGHKDVVVALLETAKQLDKDNPSPDALNRLLAAKDNNGRTSLHLVCSKDNDKRKRLDPSIAGHRKSIVKSLLEKAMELDKGE